MHKMRNALYLFLKTKAGRNPLFFYGFWSNENFI